MARRALSHTFAVALNYAIAIRTSHGKERSGKDIKSDERHRHFVGILEQVRETLRSLMDPQVAKAAGLHDDPAIALSNRFAELKVEELSEEFLRAPDVSLPPIKAHFEEKRDAREEALLAIELILEDYKSFRNVIRECWQEYHEGTRDLIEISIMTNTAMDLARRLEADAEILIDECGGFNAVFEQYCEDSTADASLVAALPEDQRDLSMHKTDEPFLISTYPILEEFLQSIQDESLPVTEAAKEGPGTLPKLRDSPPLDPAAVEAKHQADKSFLHAMLLDFYVVTMKMKPILPEDELTRGLRAVFETRRSSLWVIFALEVYLDINYMFRDDVARGYWDLYKFGVSISESIYDNLTFFGSIPCDPWPPIKDEALAQLREDVIKIVNEDLIWQRKKGLGLSGAVLGGSNQHWKSHPVRCGLMAYNIRMRYQGLSVEFENKWQTIYYTYTLYYTLRFQNLLRTPWKDMEALIHEQPHIDLSSRTKTFEDIMFRVGTDLGVSASLAGSDRKFGSRIPIVDERTQNIRLQERNPVALMFKKRFCDNDGRTNFTEEDLVNILSKAMSVVSKKSKKTKKNKKIESANGERPTIPQLLQTLRAKLVSEKSTSDFDYLEFNRLCWQLLREVRPKCKSRTSCLTLR